MHVDVMSFDAGSGHVASALAIQRALQQVEPTWKIRVIDLCDVLNTSPILAGFYFEQGIRFFNACMRRESYFALDALLKANVMWRGGIFAFAPFLNMVARSLSRFWVDRNPDVVISVTPLMHSLAYKAARAANSDVRCITIPVDHGEATPGYWFDRRIDQDYLVATDLLETQARAAGVPANRIRRICGMPIDPEFYNEADPIEESDSGFERDPDLPTGLISFGGQGTVDVLRAAKGFIDQEIPVNLVCLCGRNSALLQKVRNLPSKYPLHAQAFQSAPPVRLHQLADFLIGKPGTMTLNEALITRTPLIFVKSRGMKSIQQPNEHWITQRGIGIGVDSAADAATAAMQIISNPATKSALTRNYHIGLFDAIAQIQALIADRQASPQPASRAA